MQITAVGLDLAKNTFHLVGFDAQGREVMKKQMSRVQVLRHFVNVPFCLVAWRPVPGLTPSHAHCPGTATR